MIFEKSMKNISSQKSFSNITQNYSFYFSDKMINDNPWGVSTLEDFLHFCCPECDVKDKSKELFLEHISKKHPKAKHFLTSWTSSSIKSEINPAVIDEEIRNFDDIIKEEEQC